MKKSEKKIIYFQKKFLGRENSVFGRKKKPYHGNPPYIGNIKKLRNKRIVTFLFEAFFLVKNKLIFSSMRSVSKNGPKKQINNK